MLLENQPLNIGDGICSHEVILGERGNPRCMAELSLNDCQKPTMCRSYRVEKHL